MHRGKIRGIRRFLELKSIRDSWPADFKSRLENPEGEGDFMQRSQLTGAETYQIYGTLQVVRRFGENQSRGETVLLRWLVLYLLQQSGSGHIRINREDFCADFPLWVKAAGVTLSSREVETLLADTVEQHPRLFASLPDGHAPILLSPDGESFYLLKRWRYEKRFLLLLEPLVGEQGRRDLPGWAGADRLLPEVYRELKGHSHLLMGDETLSAAEMVFSRLFSVITGGPGTGKTTILGGMLNLLLETGSRLKQPLLDIRLCAPTGRAAGRMEESLKELLGHQDFSAAFPVAPCTLHKLLGLVPGAPPRFSRNRPLSADLVVVDEASMVDLNLMFYVLDALKPGARILLVGDKDQLPSVEAGALLSDFLHGRDEDTYRLAGGVLSLTRVHRSSGAILEGASLVIRGETEGFREFLNRPERAEENGPSGDTGLFCYASIPDFRNFLEMAGEDYGLKQLKQEIPAFSASISSWEDHKGEISRFFQLYRDAVILVPSRKGLFGINSVNRALSSFFAPGEGAVFHGQPIMITRNDYERELFNGDRGVILSFRGYHYAFFEGSGAGEYRHFPVTLLGEYQTAFAMTIHKSQGSEYRDVTVIIPDGTDRLLSREILYTGITRARQKVRLLSRVDLMEKALSRGVRRQSGIREFMISP